MFVERRVMEKHLLGTLIFLSNMFNTSSLKEIQHNLRQAAAPERNVSRGAFKTFQFLWVAARLTTML